MSAVTIHFFKLLKNPLVIGWTIFGLIFLPTNVRWKLLLLFFIGQETLIHQNLQKRLIAQVQDGSLTMMFPDISHQAIFFLQTSP